MSQEPRRLLAQAVLLGERIDHRAIAPSDAPLTDPVPLSLEDGATGFAFRWGVVVSFGATASAQAALLARLAPHVTNPLATRVDETARIELGADQDGIDAQGVIRLQDMAVPRLALVADALAKSAALSHQEAQIAQTLDWMEPMIADLSRRGRLSMASRPLLRSIGAALAARSRATGRVGAEDKPDLLWDHPGLERLHGRLADEFELPERGAALERKLSLIGETTGTLLSLIEARRSLGLELAIVVLVAIEVMHTLYGAIFN